MKTNINIDKISKLIERLKELNADIITIEKIVLLISDSDKSFDYDFSLAVTDLNPQKDEKKNILDEDGSLIKSDDNVLTPEFGFSIFSHIAHKMLRRGSENSNKTTYEINTKININTMLSMLGIIMNERQEERNKIIKLLNKNNINI